MDVVVDFPCFHRSEQPVIYDRRTSPFFFALTFCPQELGWHIHVVWHSSKILYMSLNGEGGSYIFEVPYSLCFFLANSLLCLATVVRSFSLFFGEYFVDFPFSRRWWDELVSLRFHHIVRLKIMRWSYLARRHSIWESWDEPGLQKVSEMRNLWVGLVIMMTADRTWSYPDLHFNTCFSPLNNLQLLSCLLFDGFGNGVEVAWPNISRFQNIWYSLPWACLLNALTCTAWVWPVVHVLYGERNSGMTPEISALPGYMVVVIGFWCDLYFSDWLSFRRDPWFSVTSKVEHLLSLSSFENILFTMSVPRACGNT